MNSSNLARAPRRARMASSIAAAVAVLAASACQDPAFGRSPEPATHASRVSAKHLVPMSHTVTSCSDDFVPGTLRWTLADPNTHSGDSVDLSQLTCSHITLGSELKIHQDDLTLLGPGPAPGFLSLVAYNQSGIIEHFGYGTLEIHGLDIQQGYFTSDTDPTGGCVWSRGTLSLIDTNVHFCGARSLSATAPAFGGALYTKGSLSLVRSVVSNSRAYSFVGGAAAGGGAFVKGNLTSDSSAITDNIARTTNGGTGKGGGAFVRGSVDIDSSTIAGNRANVGGGLAFYSSGAPSVSATLTNSTVSGNSAIGSVGGIYSTMPLKLASTTIAFNRALDPSSTGGGLFVESDLDMTNSIVAYNVTTSGASDIDGSAGVVISGSKNLVLQAGPHVTVPMDTIDACPKLDALVVSGGFTPTHRLRQASAAIDNGDAGNLSTDQRGLPRVAGPSADIGSVEQQDGEPEERVMSSSFDGPCDL